MQNIILSLIILIIIYNAITFTFKVKNFFNPVLILSIFWFLILILYIFIGNTELGKLSFKTYIVIYSGIVIFQVFSWLAIIVNKNQNFNLMYLINIKNIKIITLVNFLLIINYTVKVYTLSRKYSELALLHSIARFQFLDGNNIGIFKYVVPFSLCLGFYSKVFIYYYQIKDKKIKFFLNSNFLIAVFLLIFFVGNRISLFSFIIGIIFAKYILKEWIYTVQMKNIKNIIILFLSGIIIFFLLGYAFKPDMMENAGVKANIISYFILPIKSLDLHVVGVYDIKSENFGNLLRFFYEVLNKFGFSISTPEVIKYYINFERYTTNIHTSYLLYMEDNLYFGIFVHLSFLGFLMSKLFINRKKNIVFLFLYSYWIEIILTQYANDTFFPVLSIRIQQVVYSIIFTKIFIKNRGA